MKFPRRKFLHFATGAAALPGLSCVASALDYPTRPVHLVVGYPPGGAPDIVSRLMAEWLSERFGQQFIVDNRAGAGSNIGTEIVAKAPADGYMLFMAVSTNAVNASLLRRKPWSRSTSPLSAWLIHLFNECWIVVRRS